MNQEEQLLQEKERKQTNKNKKIKKLEGEIIV